MSKITNDGLTQFSTGSL